MTQERTPRHPVRFVTAASLFDGHDASINIMRRILQSQGAEVIHLGHDRSVDEVVQAAVQEDVQGVAVCSYQGGHVEYFTYLVRPARQPRRRPRPGLRRRRRRHRARGDRGARRAAACASSPPRTASGSASPGMINDDGRGVRRRPRPTRSADLDAVLAGDDRAPRPRDHRARGRAARPRQLARRSSHAAAARATHSRCSASPAPAARASRRSPTSWCAGFRADQEDKLRIAVLAVDPTRRRGGGALLGDRIRMNALDPARVYFRSLATRGAGSRGARAPRRRHRRVPGRRLRPGHRRDARHRPGRRRHRPARRRLALRHDAGVRRRLAAREDRHARLRRRRGDQQVRAPRRRGRPARRRAASSCATARPSASTWEDMPVFGTSAPPASTTTASPRLYQHLRDLLAEQGPGGRRRASCRRLEGKELDRARHGRARRPRVATSPRSPRPCAATTPRTEQQADAARRRAAPAHRARLLLAEPAPTASAVEALLARAGGRPAARRSPRQLAALARRPRAVPRRRAGRHGARQGAAHAADARDAVGHAASRASRCRATDDARRARALPARGEPARPLPVHRRRLPVQARGRGPGAHVRRRGRPGPHQPPLPPALRRASPRPACRPRSTRSPSTAATRTSGPTSTARSARRASRSRRSTT